MNTEQQQSNQDPVDQGQVPRNAIGILAETNAGITAFINWLQQSVRYALAYGGISPAGSDAPGCEPAQIEAIMADLIHEVERDRHQGKLDGGTVGEVTDQDVQALVNRMVAFMWQRSLTVHPMQLNEVLNGLASGIAASCWDTPGRVAEITVHIPIQNLKGFCPPLAQLIEAKVVKLREVQREKDKAREKKDKNNKLIEGAGQPLG